MLFLCDGRRNTKPTAARLASGGEVAYFGKKEGRETVFLLSRAMGVRYSSPRLYTSRGAPYPSSVALCGSIGTFDKGGTR